MTGLVNFAVRQSLGDDARMGCGICWIVYDLAAGTRGRA
ncbi:hypothetical protein FBZ93_11679 [Bradyrhizobium macuxiense]|uniref:Uncharacterized protein n=1 Tax=Bradyrhizobium macuxiense TaxID=1755647 RepID=A0A560L1K6_9BRAD|nr:hypothetical protein FBZ93_11679 [Bradyrhizobium macuxiense]